MTSESADYLQLKFERLIVDRPDLMYHEDFPEVKVILKSEQPKTHVSVVAPGGDIEDYADLISGGILSAAVYEDEFAAPRATSYAAGVKATTGAAGCLLVGRNYHVESLQAAADISRKGGLNVEVLTCSKLTPTISSAGTAASGGSDLEEVMLKASASADRISCRMARAMWSKGRHCCLCGEYVAESNKYTSHWNKFHKKAAV